MTQQRAKHKYPLNSTQGEQRLTQKELKAMANEALTGREVACIECHHTVQLRKIRPQNITRR